MKKLFLLTLLITVALPALGMSGNAAAAEKPNVRSNYILIFQATEYDSKIGDAIDFFFKKILKPEDHLSIITPVNPYNFSPQTRQTYPIEKLIERTKDVLKRDITIGVANYQQILANMMQLVRDISGNMVSGADASASSSTALSSDLKSSLGQYRQLLENMRNLRKLNENLFMQLAGLFKKETGKNYLYIFYQKELRIIPNPNALQRLVQSYEYKADATELFESDRDEAFLNTETVGMALKDASVTLNFIYLNKSGKTGGGMEYKEFSGDVYNALSKLATATGGFAETTSKPEAALKNAIENAKK